MTDFSVEILDQIKAVDLEEYMEYLKVYQNGDKTETNGERGLKRKISALRSFYAYYYMSRKSMTKALSAWTQMKLRCFWTISSTAEIA